WILGHVVATRCLILPLVGQTSIWSEDLVNSYKRYGSKDVTAPFDEIVHGFSESYERLVQGLEGLTDDVLASPVPNSPSNDPNDTVASLLVTIAFHESYHIGQVGVLRRIVGKEGVIK
ncbi:MAG TPA: DinB family protein, partial [Thermoanaerobaculia bacterium]|nr:DinB family protein [Thermoanaerobaculia bacterium]